MNVVQTLLLNLPVIAAARVLASRWRGSRGRLDVWLSASVLAWGWVTAGALALGSVKMLLLPQAVGWSLIAGIGGLAMLRRRTDVATGNREQIQRIGLLGSIALATTYLAGTALAAQSFVWPVRVLSDGPIYHLYFAIRWWKAGAIFLVPTPFGETAAPYFPANGDVWFAWLTLGWGGDRLARIGQAPFLVVAGLAAFAMARRLGASASASALATSLFLSINPLIFFTFEPNVDTIFVAGYLVSAYFLVRLWQGDAARSTQLLAGLAAGLAWGTKPTGTVFVPLLLVFGFVANRAGGARMSRFLIVLAATAAGCAFWYARNALLTGNPLYPLQVTLFGRTVLTGWYGSKEMKFSQYYIPVGDWRTFLDILLGVIDFRLAPLWCLTIFGLRRKNSGKLTNSIVLALFVLALANIAAYWFLLPYRTQPRFMLHALGLLVVPLSRFLDRGLGWRVVALVAVLIHLFTWQAGPIPHDISPLVPSDFPPMILWSWLSSSVGIIAVGVLAAGVIAISGEKRSRRALGIALFAGVVAVSILGAWQLRQQSLSPILTSFPMFPDYVPGWVALEGRSGPSGTRIAYAGTNLPYYLMGTDLRNTVRYVNIDEHRGWLLHDYHAAAVREGHPNWPGPRPGWDRIHPNFDAWLANLRAEKIQLLVVARIDRAEGWFNAADPEGFPIERVWADAHPEIFTPLYGQNPPDPAFRLYRVRQPSDESKKNARIPRQLPTITGSASDRTILR